MWNPARRTRRILGLSFLAAAILFLFAGQTFLRGHLHGLSFIVYWLACLGLVALALFTALLDALVIRHQTRQQHLQLIRETLGNPPRTPPNSTRSVAPDPPCSRAKPAPGANS
jgi:type VI protein secretion system component VasK